MKFDPVNDWIMLMWCSWQGSIIWKFWGCHFIQH